MVDEVRACERRDHQQRLPWAETAAGLLRARRAGGHPREVGAALAGRSQRVQWSLGLPEDRSHLVVVPAVGVVVGDHHGGAAPGAELLQAVDRADQEGLLVQWI